MNKRIASFIKYNKSILYLYRTFGNACISVLKILIKKDPQKIMFMSFGGQKYDDSPRAIYEVIKDDPFFEKYKLVWAFTNPKSQPDIGCKKIKTETIEFYKTAISAKYWIHNSSMERGLKLKTSSTFELNTNHGIPLKLYGYDIKGSDSFSSKTMEELNVFHCAQSEFERKIYVRSTGANPDNFIMCGLPRNDSLFRYTKEDIQKIRKEIGIPEGKKVLLYAPTYREYDRDQFNSCYIDPPINKEKWKKQIGNDYVVLFRAHYEIINVLGINNDGLFINVSAYPYSVSYHI